MVKSNQANNSSTVATAPAVAANEYTGADARLLLDSVVELTKFEQEIFEKANEYVADHPQLRNGKPGAFARYLLEGRAKNEPEPAWFAEKQDGQAVKHGDSREVIILLGMLERRDEYLAEFKNQAAVFNDKEKPVGGDVNAAIGTMRQFVLGPRAKGEAAPETDETILATLNKLGKVGDPADPAALYIIDKGFPGNASAYLAGTDKLAHAKRVITEKVDDFKQAIPGIVSGIVTQLEKLGNFIIDGSKKAADAATDIAQHSANSPDGNLNKAGNWFSKTWDSITKWGKETFGEDGKFNFGSVAGGFGVGALFYLVSNSLGGRGMIGKVIGLMAGVLGVVLGAKFFGGKGDDDTPVSTVSAPTVSRMNTLNGQNKSDPANLRAKDETPELDSDDKQRIAQAVADAKAQCAIDMQRSNSIKQSWDKNHPNEPLPPSAPSQACIDAASHGRG